MALITIRVEQSVLIKLPVEEVFAYMCDLENLKEWCNTTFSIENIPAEVGGEGARVHGIVQFLGKWSEMTLEIVECRLNEYLTIKSTTGTAPCLFCYQFEPGENGETLLIQEATLRYMESRTTLTQSTMSEAVRSQLASDLLTLKDNLETRTLTLRNG